MTLEDEMRQLLARMSLIQYGKTASLNGSGGRSENPDPRPQGESWTLADHWAAEWRKNPSHETVEAARVELGAWLKRSAPAADDGTAFEDWVVDDGEGYAVAQVASKFGIAEARVRRIRLKAERESEFGLPLRHAAVRDVSVSKEQRIRNLADQGCTERQIAFQVSVSKSTVRRALGRAA